MPYDPIPGEVPRKVAIDRKRKEFRLLNFEKLLRDEVINNSKIKGNKLLEQGLISGVVEIRVL